jgi:hypothetical protein
MCRGANEIPPRGRASTSRPSGDESISPTSKLVDACARGDTAVEQPITRNAMSMSRIRRRPVEGLTARLLLEAGA